MSTALNTEQTNVPPGTMNPVVIQQRGFWRSPKGEHHGLNSQPGDEWATPESITDTDRLRFVVEKFNEDTFACMPDDSGLAREYIDELMLDYAPVSNPPTNAK